MAVNNVHLVPMEELVPLFCEQLNAGGKVSFTPRGNSMRPMLRHGIDTVELSPIIGELKKYDVVLYRRDNGKYVLHRIVKAGESYTCIGDNQYHREYGLRRDQMIAIVTAFTRKGKAYSTDSPGYKLYYRLWHYSRFPRRVLRGIKYRIKRLLNVCR